jgi:hypothetical protein
MGLKPAVTANPLEAPEFSALRTLRRAFSRGGLPPLLERTPDDEARIAAFFALQQLLLILDEFRRACARGESVHLEIDESGMSPTRLLMTIAIVKDEKQARE